MTSSTLYVNFSNNALDRKATIPLAPNSVDTTSTSLRLHGRGSPNYGSDLWTNMIKIMENFCSPDDPIYPTEGQLWYNAGTKQLSIYTRNSDNAYFWDALAYDNKPITIPPDLIKGFIKDNGTIPMVAPLILELETYDNNDLPLITTQTQLTHATSRKYVDRKISKLESSIITLDNLKDKLLLLTDLPFLYKTSGSADDQRTMSNVLILVDEFNSSGNLLTPTSRANRLNASSRAYVDYQVSELKNYVDNKPAAAAPTQNNTGLSEADLAAALAKLTGANNPFIKKRSSAVVDRTMIDQLILPTYSLPLSSKDNELEAASRKYVDDSIAAKTTAAAKAPNVSQWYIEYPNGMVTIYGELTEADSTTFIENSWGAKSGLPALGMKRYFRKWNISLPFDLHPNYIIKSDVITNTSPEIDQYAKQTYDPLQGDWGSGYKVTNHGVGDQWQVDGVVQPTNMTKNSLSLRFVYKTYVKIVNAVITETIIQYPVTYTITGIKA